jgi:type II secretory pathway pseudopilin PulG
MKSPRKTQSGLSALEVAVLVALLCVLGVILLPAIKHAQLRANQARSADNLRQIGQAMHLFARDHTDQLPPWRYWVTHLKPYLPESAYWRPGGPECFYNGNRTQTGVCWPCGYGVESGIRFNYSLPYLPGGAFGEWSASPVKLATVHAPGKVLAGFEGLGPDTSGYCYWPDDRIQELWLDGHVAPRFRSDQPFAGDILLK